MQNRIRNIYHALRRWTYQSHEGAMRGWRLASVRVARFFVLFWHLFSEDRILQRASSLAYATILSIFPLLAVIAAMASVFTGGAGNLEDQIVNFMEETIMPPVSSPVDGWLSPSQAQEIEKRRENLQDITDTVRKMFRTFRDNATEIGFIGFVGVLLAAGLLYATVEQAFNDMWNVYERRGPIRTLTTFTTLIVCVPILIGLSITVSVNIMKFNQRMKEARTEQVSADTGRDTAAAPGDAASTGTVRQAAPSTTSTIAGVIGREEPPTGVPVTSRIAASLIPPLINGIFLALAYLLIPRTRVSAGYALVGGLLAGFVWEAAKVSFGLYVFSSTLRNVLFRSLGAVPIFLIWIYFTWVVFLAGNEVVYILHNYRTLRRERFARPDYTTLDSKLIFAVALLIADSFERNRGGIQYDDLKTALGIRDAELHAALHVLRKHKLVMRTDSRTYTLTRPAHNIPVRQILELGCNVPRLFHSPDRQSDRIESIFEDLQQTLESWHKDGTLDDVLGSLSPEQKSE